jgi:hypothetical protein
VTWPSPFPALEHWTDRQHELFQRHCGEVMETYYPDWRDRGHGS